MKKEIKDTDNFYKLIQNDVSVRLLNCLKQNEIDTVADIKYLTMNDIMRFRNFGKKSLIEIKEICLKLGIWKEESFPAKVEPRISYNRYKEALALVYAYKQQIQKDVSEMENHIKKY